MIIFTGGIVKKITRVVVSLLEHEIRQGNHLKNPRQTLFVGVIETDVRSLV